ncbi:hypothetical protein K438DRAFT_203563 [Mycena galopus ATCC 62051]|nr:hypothetical protein K438DRAFT_203563 [Mycena galopus ATCC 62051]
MSMPIRWCRCLWTGASAGGVRGCRAATICRFILPCFFTSFSVVYRPVANHMHLIVVRGPRHPFPTRVPPARSARLGEELVDPCYCWGGECLSGVSLFFRSLLWPTFVWWFWFLLDNGPEQYDTRPSTYTLGYDTISGRAMRTLGIRFHLCAISCLGASPADLRLHLC